MYYKEPSGMCRGKDKNRSVAVLFYVFKLQGRSVVLSHRNHQKNKYVFPGVNRSLRLFLSSLNRLYSKYEGSFVYLLTPK